MAVPKIYIQSISSFSTSDKAQQIGFHELIVGPCNRSDLKIYRRRCITSYLQALCRGRCDISCICASCRRLMCDISCLMFHRRCRKMWYWLPMGMERNCEKGNISKCWTVVWQFEKKKKNWGTRTSKCGWVVLFSVFRNLRKMHSSRNPTWNDQLNREIIVNLDDNEILPGDLVHRYLSRLNLYRSSFVISFDEEKKMQIEKKIFDSIIDADYSTSEGRKICGIITIR